MESGPILVEEARRSLDGQRKDLEAARTRAGGIFGFASVAVTFATATGEPLSGFAATVVGALFLLLTVAVGVALWPRELTFEMNVAALDSASTDVQTLDHLQRSVATSLWSYRVANQDKLQCMTHAYSAALGLLALEVLALTSAVVIGW